MTEEWQKRDTWEEKEGRRTGNEERTVGMKEAWIFSRFERAKRWGSICRKIDWTGVTFALVFARAVILDRRGETNGERYSRKIPRESFRSKSQKNVRQSDSFFFLENVCSNRESEDLASKPSIEKINDERCAKFSINDVVFAAETRRISIDFERSQREGPNYLSNAPTTEEIR